MPKQVIGPYQPLYKVLGKGFVVRLALESSLAGACDFLGGS